jgi:hypothetical protein
MDVQKETSEIRELKAEELDEVAGGPGFVGLEVAPVGPFAQWFPPTPPYTPPGGGGGGGGGGGPGGGKGIN